MDWNAVIEEFGARDGNFRAVLREVPIEIVSRDPEHDLCHAMVKTGLADGSIQFWRGATPSLRYRSVYRMAEWCVDGGLKRHRRKAAEAVKTAAQPRTDAAAATQAKTNSAAVGEAHHHSGEGLPNG